MRSGTHKAMVLLWLERNDLMRCKSYLYGRTRSWSLIGSGVSAVLSIFIMLLVQSQDRQEDIFIFSVLPYVADLVMVASYPSYMDFDEAKQAKKAKKAKEAAAAGTAVKNEPWYLQPVADMRSLLQVVGDPVRRIVLSYRLRHLLTNVGVAGEATLLILIVHLHELPLHFETFYTSRRARIRRSGALIDLIEGLYVSLFFMRLRWLTTPHAAFGCFPQGLRLHRLGWS